MSKKIFREPDFGSDKYGNPVWFHRYTASVIVGLVIGSILGLLILAVEL